MLSLMSFLSYSTFLCTFALLYFWAYLNPYIPYVLVDFKDDLNVSELFLVSYWGISKFSGN